MSLETHDDIDFEEIFNAYKEPVEKSPKIDVILEHYLTLVSELKKDLHDLRDDFSLHQKSEDTLSNSLEEFLSIQKLSSVVSKDLEIPQIADHLKNVTAKLIPIVDSELFIFEDNEFRAIGSKTSRDLSLILSCAREEGIINWLWEEKHPMIVPLSDFLIYKKLKRKKGNVILVPLLEEREGLGVYILVTAKDQSNFSIRDLELLNVLVQQTVLAIQVRRLKVKERQQRDQLIQFQKRFMKLLRLATVGELAGGFAHEINNPLQIIMGNIQMARMGQRLEESLDILDKQTERIANIVRGLLNMVRQNNDSVNQYIEINPLIVNTLNLVRGQIEKRKIEISMELENKLPVVQCSSIFFQQILLNFILHAKMQIGHSGKINIKTSGEGREWIQIEISDSGIPMPSEYIEKIMDPFSDLENSTEVNLGLTVSVEMVRELGGDISIQSRKNSGNQIVMRIPVRPVQAESGERRTASTG
ncbi:MAG: hypothetical protein EH225_09165 [Calditrichaeota bacterium]|nr:MAG: hypothetical protein EH225_09165 [Calditrichota bacterium]